MGASDFPVVFHERGAVPRERVHNCAVVDCEGDVFDECQTLWQNCSGEGCQDVGGAEGECVVQVEELDALAIAT